MHSAFGQVVLAVFLIGGTGVVMLAMIARVREAGTHGTSAPRAAKGGKGQVLQMLAHPSPRHIRAATAGEIRRMREQYRLDDWLEGRRHARQNGTPAADGNGAQAAAPAKPERTLTAALRKLAPAPAAQVPGNGNGNGSSPAPAGTRPAPPAPGPASPSANGTHGGTTTVAAGTSTGSVEKLIEGVNQIHAEAAAGGIHAKQRGIKSATEGSIRFSAMASMLSRAMSEPGSNYGPEITEPLAKASEHLQAAAMSFSEADTSLTTLLNMSVGELAQSSRQAPHHAELSESGSH